MAGGVIASVLAPHTPRMGDPENAPDFVKPLIQSQYEMGEVIRALKPDVIVLQSAHWVSTFPWYAASHAVHEGVCIADEAPDLFAGIPYKRTGEPGFANALTDAIKGLDVPCGVNNNPNFRFDYGTMLPIKHIDPNGEIPFVPLPTVVCSDLEENRQVGRLIHKVAVDRGQQVVFVASCALAHKVRRGPALWPTDPEQALDRQFIELVEAGDLDGLLAFAPRYVIDATAEMGGRILYTMLGAMEAMRESSGDLVGLQYGPYTQSSGSGNANLSLVPA